LTAGLGTANLGVGCESALILSLTALSRHPGIPLRRGPQP
jgi:hypothetical protein